MRAIFVLLLAAAFAAGQDKPLPELIFFAGASADPNGTVADVAGDVGGAKLVGSSTYVGAVAHLSKGNAENVRLSTKLQFHVAQRVSVFRGAHVFWTAEVGPDFVSTQVAPIPPGAASTNVGYAIGSGPLVSVPLGRGFFLMPHAEVTKGSVADFGWRGGFLIGIGSK